MSESRESLAERIRALSLPEAVARIAVDGGETVSPALWFRAQSVRQDEEVFLARVTGSEVLDTSGWDVAEQEFMDEVRWFELDELAAVTIEVFPEGIVELVRGLLGGWDGTSRNLGLMQE